MNPILKDDPVRSKALRDAARDQDCVSCNRNDGTTVLAHLAFPLDSGLSIKCCDYWAAHLCSECHKYADGPDGRRDWQWRGSMIHKTIRRLVQSGIVRFPA